MLRLGICASGNLGLETLEKLAKDSPCLFVLTDSKSTEIIEFTEKNKIPCFQGNPRIGNVTNFIKPFEIDVLVSINYLFLMEENLINHPKKLAINIHGSLLPKYRGRTPHVWAIINGEEFAGITVHKIELGCDTGAIIQQKKIKIEADDSGATMLNKYAAEYYPMLSSCLASIEKNTVEITEQDHDKATFYGKRTPNDGEINWNWHKVRIQNWIRAQRDPYPGAFTFINDQKLIIDEVALSDKGYTAAQKNGEVVISGDDMYVKCPNGLIKLIRIRNNVTLENGVILKGIE